MPSNGLQDFEHKRNFPYCNRKRIWGLDLSAWTLDMVDRISDLVPTCGVLRLWDYEANAIKPRRGYKCKYCVQHWYAFNNVRNFQYIHACINIFDGFIFLFQICSRSYIVCALHCKCLTYSQPVHTLLLSLENDDKMWVNQTTLFP